MTSTDIKTGLTCSTRPSSRILKPPGGGHTNIFAEAEVAVNAPRPKHNQQNSSNMNACMGSTDPNVKVEKLREEITTTTQQTSNNEEHQQTKASSKTKGSSNANNATNENGNGNNAARTGRVPPGGYSSGGFW